MSVEWLAPKLDHGFTDSTCAVPDILVIPAQSYGAHVWTRIHPSAPPRWHCDYCGRTNADERENCRSCGAPRKC